MPSVIAQRVAAARARFHQQAAEPRVDAGRVLEQPGGPEQPFGAGAVGAPEQRADQLFDHDQGGIGKRRVHLNRERDQRGHPPATLQAAKVLRRHNARDARDHGIARAVNAACPVGLDPERADPIETLDQRLQVGRGRCLRPVTDPAQPRAILFARVDQFVEPRFLFRRAVPDQTRKC